MRKPEQNANETNTSSVDYSTMVLLVDDQPMVAQAVGRLLADLPDIDLHYCCDPIEAIKEANSIKPSVILQDLVMPSIDGLDLVRLFRANPATAETPIAACRFRSARLRRPSRFPAAKPKLTL